MLSHRFFEQIEEKYLNKPIMVTGAAWQPRTSCQGHARSAATNVYVVMSEVLCHAWSLCITEYGCWDSNFTVLEAAAFMRQSMAFMDNDTRVDR